MIVDDVLTPEEMENAYENGWTPELSYLDEYSDFKSALNLLTRAGAMDVDMHQLVVSNRSWALFLAIRATYGRYAFLLGQSMRNRKGRKWQYDDMAKANLQSVLPTEIVDQVATLGVRAFSTAIEHLEQEFLTYAGPRPH